MSLRSCVCGCVIERERELGMASDRGEKVQRHHVSGGNLASPPPHKGGLRCSADDDGDD